MYNEAGLVVLTFLLMLPYIVGLAISVAIAYYIYKDAKKRYPPNSNDPLLWAVVGFFLSILGLLIYLLKRPERIQQPWYPQPQTAQQPPVQQPSYVQQPQQIQPMNYPQPRQMKFCPRCGLQVDPSWISCPRCGARLR